MARERNLWQSFKRQSIQEAVIRLMCREGLRSVTMERVAQEVGIAKGTVYLHYRDKQELLDAVKESALVPLMAKLDEVFRSDIPPDRRLENYSLRYLTYFDERKELFRILLYEREVVRVWGSRYRNDRYKHLVTATAAAIEEGISQGLFRSDIDPARTAAMFVESNFALLNHRLLTEDPGPVEDDARLVSRLFLDGMRSKGRKKAVK